MTVHDLRERLKDGMRYKDIDRRLETIEALLAQQAIKDAESRGVISWEQLVHRVGEARVAAGLGDKSSFFLVASPGEGVQFHGIFSSSQSPEVQLIDNPPKYREQGFDLDAGDPSRMVRAELIRRAAPGRKGLELWRDGSLIFVGRGDSNFLGWTQREDGASLFMNNYVAATPGASSGLPPGAQYRVSRRCGDIFLADGQKFPSDEPAYCRLHGTFRYSNSYKSERHKSDLPNPGRDDEQY
jgi:hypothetical protein